MGISTAITRGSYFRDIPSTCLELIYQAVPQYLDSWDSKIFLLQFYCSTDFSTSDAVKRVAQGSLVVLLFLQ
ncbi:unnamed protein product [Nezara viridula]|uniref:Uncharacterized protein n=1 Tax=Nezara viridula TaxID=85310 RepID=A0A9P0MPB4_NEZVI|nr:unnamed protein product [Nezara viridula]